MHQKKCNSNNKIFGEKGVGGQGIICKSKVLQFTRTNKRCFKLLTIVQLTVPSDATLLEDPSEPFF